MTQVMHMGACVSLYITAHLIFQQPEGVENQLIFNTCVNDDDAAWMKRI